MVAERIEIDRAFHVPELQPGMSWKQFVLDFHVTKRSMCHATAAIETCIVQNEIIELTVLPMEPNLESERRDLVDTPAV